MNCLNNIVGITENPNVCLPIYTQSLSGFFLEDTTAGRIPIQPAFYQNTNLIESIIPNAINEALKEIRLATEKRLLRVYNNHITTIGFRNDYTGLMGSTNDWYYLCLKPKNIRGAIMTINSINIFTGNGKFTGNIKILKGMYGEEILYDGLITEFEKMTIDISHDDVFVAYQSNSAPRNFIHKSCCGKQAGYKNYLWVGSGTVSDLENIQYSDSDYCNGVELSVVFDCDGFQFIEKLDFQRSPFGIVFAKLVQQIARKNIGYWLLTSENINAYSIAKEDELRMILEYLSNDIQTMINYLPENYDHSDCYRCTGVFKDEILI